MKNAEKEQGSKKLTAKEKKDTWDETSRNVEQYIGITRSSESWRVVKEVTNNTKEKSHITYIREKQWDGNFKTPLEDTRAQFMKGNEARWRKCTG